MGQAAVGLDADEPDPVPVQGLAPAGLSGVRGPPLLGLPGNPVAAAVSFEQFGRPAILKMLGRRDLTIPTIEATLTERINNRGGLWRGGLRYLRGAPSTRR